MHGAVMPVYTTTHALKERKKHEGQVFSPCPKRAPAESTCWEPGEKRRWPCMHSIHLLSSLNACMLHAHATHLHPVPSKGLPTMCPLPLVQALAHLGTTHPLPLPVGDPSSHGM
jgi:hypothetical protein